MRNKKSGLFITIIFVMFLYACDSENKEAKGETIDNKNLQMSERLEGVKITYRYEKGNQYSVKFEDDSLSYQFHKGGKKSKRWIGPYAYNHLITDMNQHMVAWHEPDKQDYVTLLINFDKMSLYGSAILKGKKQHFQKAEITELVE